MGAGERNDRRVPATRRHQLRRADDHTLGNLSANGKAIMPDVRETSDDTELSATAAEDDRHAELLLAGFRACAKEALRFLLEEEGLSPDHPLPCGLEEHLIKRQCHLVNILHNDSGIDLTESFMHSSTDGDTTCEINSSGGIPSDNEYTNISGQPFLSRNKNSLPHERKDYEPRCGKDMNV